MNNGKKTPVAVRLAARLMVDEATGCHIWTGALTHNGYGAIGTGGAPRMKRTHRVAYELARGPIPEGMQIDHLCRNRACCNPDHLEAVTPAENTRRGDSPATVAARTNTCFRGHPLEGWNVITNGNGGRACRTCSNASRLRWLRRSREAGIDQ